MKVRRSDPRSLIGRLRTDPHTLAIEFFSTMSAVLEYTAIANTLQFSGVRSIGYSALYGQLPNFQFVVNLEIGLAEIYTNPQTAQ